MVQCSCEPGHYRHAANCVLGAAARSLHFVNGGFAALRFSMQYISKRSRWPARHPFLEIIMVTWIMETTTGKSKMKTYRSRALSNE
jgi:hypothetical protein